MPICRGKQGMGFTLVEVMVALVVFLIASMGLLPLLMNSLLVNRDNNQHAQARCLAGEAMAELQVVEYASLGMAACGSLMVGEIEVDRQVEQDQPQADQSRLTVTAHWQQQGRVHSYRLQMIRSRP